MYNPVKFWGDRAKNRPNEWQEDIRFVVEWTKPFLKPKTKVLDVGCGNGRLQRQFRKAGILSPVYMCDITMVQCREAKRTSSGQVILWDGKTLPFKDNTFDLVVTHTFFTHVEPYLLKQLWNECIRVCKDAWFTTLNRWKQKRKEKPGDYCYTHDYNPLLLKTPTIEAKGEILPKTEYRLMRLKK